MAGDEVVPVGGVIVDDVVELWAGGAVVVPGVPPGDCVVVVLVTVTGEVVDDPQTVELLVLAVGGVVAEGVEPPGGVSVGVTDVTVAGLEVVSMGR